MKLVGTVCLLCRFFTEANRKAPEGATDAEAARFRTQMLHSYLLPVDVELSIEFGGALDKKDGWRTTCIQVTAHVRRPVHQPCCLTRSYVSSATW